MRAEEGRFEIGIKGCIPCGFRGLAEFGLEEIGGAVDQDIEPLEILCDARHQFLNLRDVGKVGLDGDRTAAQTFDFAYYTASFGLRFAEMNRNVGAFLGKTKSDGASEALTCSGDKRHASRQFRLATQIVQFPLRKGSTSPVRIPGWMVTSLVNGERSEDNHAT